MVRRGWIPDMLTDQTSAHDPLHGYIPSGLSLDEAARLREAEPKSYTKRAIESIAIHVQAMLDMQKRGAVTFDYGNNIPPRAFEGGSQNATPFPAFIVPTLTP